MKKINVKKYSILLLSVFLAAFFTLCKTKKTYNIAVGFEGGTYEKIAESINGLSILSLNIINSHGSPEIIRLVNQGKANLGIAQMDIILDAFQEKSADAGSVKFVLPLYSEEVHLLAKKEINGVKDLAGKIISIGEKDSGTASTAEIVLGILGVNKTVKILNLDTNTALKKLQHNDIDGMFVVSGAPIQLLSDLPESLSKNYHLVQLDYKLFEEMSKILFHYKKTNIPAKTYPWQQKEVRTVSVVSSIITNEKLQDDIVKKLIESIFSNKDKLIKEHPKWKELDNNTIRWYLAGRTWKFHPAAAKSLTALVKD